MGLINNEVSGLSGKLSEILKDEGHTVARSHIRHDKDHIVMELYLKDVNRRPSYEQLLKKIKADYPVSKLSQNGEYYISTQLSGWPRIEIYIKE